MAGTIRLAAVSFRPEQVDHSKGINLSAVGRLVEEIASDKPDFICFPELCACAGGGVAGAVRNAVEHKPFVEEVSKPARAVGAALVIPFAERSGKQVFNSVPIVDSKGNHVLTYRKNYPTDKELAGGFKGETPSIKATLLAAAVQAAASKSRGKPPADPSIKAWQDKLKNLPDNTWLDLGIPVPAQGCKNISFDPVNHCLVMLGGCGGPMFATTDDYGYNNQIWMLDMQVGKYALRRAHHVWGPLDVTYRSTRMGPGCTRGSCFDSIRNVLWTSGGNGWSGVGTTHLQAYDVATDRFSTCAPAGPWGDGERHVRPRSEK
jgi:hypothetical protein